MGDAQLLSRKVINRKAGVGKKDKGKKVSRPRENVPPVSNTDRVVPNWLCSFERLRKCGLDGGGTSLWARL